MTALGAQTAYTGIGNSYSPRADAVDSGKPRFKVGVCTFADTTDAADTLVVDVYKEFGITKILTLDEFVHTTTDSVVKQEVVLTTVVDGTILTVTVPAGSDNDKRVLTVYGI